MLWRLLNSHFTECLCETEKWLFILAKVNLAEKKKTIETVLLKVNINYSGVGFIALSSG